MAAFIKSADLPVIDYPLLSSKESDQSFAPEKERKHFHESLQKLGLSIPTFPPRVALKLHKDVRKWRIDNGS